jgi:hypothetical protein
MEEPVMLVCGVILLACAAGILEWTLSPLLVAARTSTTQRRFLLTDLIWLMLQLQIAMAVVARLVPVNTSTTARVWGLVVLCVAAIAFWFASLQAVSQAGIRRPLQRGAVFVVILPGAVAAFIGLPLLAMAFLVLCFDANPDMRLARIGFVGFQLAAAIACTLALRRLASWTVVESADSQPAKC